MVTMIAASLLSSSFTIEKATFSESFRLESLTQSDFNSSETRTASKGKFTMKLSVSGNFANLATDPLVTFKLGDYKFSQLISADKKWKPGTNKAKLSQYVTGSDGVQYLDGTADLSWTPDKLSVSLTTNRDIFAAKFVSGTQSSNINAKVSGALSIGEANMGLDFIVTGRAKTIERGNGSVSAMVQTVDIKGSL